MLRTRSVDYRDCTNERIQALLVSGRGIRYLLFYLCPTPCIFKRSPSERPVLKDKHGGVRMRTTHSTKLGYCLAHPGSALLQYFLSASLRAEGVCGSWGLWRESNYS
jgi:hypothetical protein